jgi:hypothetical protein
MTPAPIRIDLWRGVNALLLTLVIPTLIAVMADAALGTLPWLTIAAVIICIPLANVVVTRILLAEFDRVVAVVAPLEDLGEAEDQSFPPKSAGPDFNIE